MVLLWSSMVASKVCYTFPSCHMIRSPGFQNVVSVGQQLSLMCIGTDVRGNIKLSLKATSPRLESDQRNVVEGSVPVQKEATHVWASIEDVSNEKKQESPLTKNNTSGVNHSTSKIPTILIRSVAECDEEEKSSGLSRSSKSGLKPTAAPKCDVREKKVPSQDDDVLSLFTIPNGFSSSKPKIPKSFLEKGRKKASNSTFKFKDGDEDRCSTSQTDTHDKLSDEETEVESLMTTKKLKLGTKVNAKIYQIRAHGLVLDLGGGIRGMYRFEGNNKDNFEVGNELLVECSSFTSKGIPVMSLVDEE
ncbi:hypothetical protein Dsin_030888 [Dipteronia sinensis]|uniref:Uncharacterized protein n=1 Tax=Dipteronia sinensis TaxID=43782 RepID=A0AAE0DRU4_9ROSI|nr:hypothetical protein Dsin_030888 [Dipteronia sinensis]